MYIFINYEFDFYRIDGVSRLITINYATWNLSLRRIVTITLLVEIDTSGLWTPKIITNNAEWNTDNEFLATRGAEIGVSFYAITYLLACIGRGAIDLSRSGKVSVWIL
jgi:hypothetical protein